MPHYLIDYTKKLMHQLENDNRYITEVYIAYKVILYYENNFGDISDTAKPQLQSIIDNIYEYYTANDDVDILDELIEQAMNKTFN